MPEPSRRPVAAPPLVVTLDEEIAPGWLAALPGLESEVERLLQGLWAEEAPKLGLDAAFPWEVTLLLIDDAEMRHINREHRGKDKPTNVLSFPQWEFPADALSHQWRELASFGEPVPLGDLLFALSTLKREAQEQHKSLQDHFLHLLVHGLLHLLGYDHQEARDADRMETRETEFLARFGIADPYTINASLKNSFSITTLD